jgi:hypothetical protein
MKQISMACAFSAIMCISSAAFAQTNPPSSPSGLQAGDNTQSVPTHQRKPHHKKAKTGGADSSATTGMGSATPGGPGAPVTASGSGG